MHLTRSQELTFQLMDEPLPRGHILVTHNPVEVQIVRLVSESPLVLEERAQRCRRRGDADARRHKHHCVVVDAKLRGGGVGSVYLDEGVSIRPL